MSSNKNNKKEFEKPRIVVCLLIEKNGKYLFTRQAPNAPRGAGKWFFPGGNVRPGETIIETLKREGWEEIGVEVKFKELVGYAEYVKAPYHFIALICRCQIIKGEINPGSDVDKAEFISRKDFHKYPLRMLQTVVIDGEEIKELTSV
ncbi:hypothetical protein A2Z41_00420 [Microgenomates group bacterium RBG_19FT_COMBO_39_10]|nr:MAG: hypothetical protein A2Z41_00420 [Microgenomates group bacterium RBG_19FT_COMBO_39_10]